MYLWISLSPRQRILILHHRQLGALAMIIIKRAKNVWNSWNRLGELTTSISCHLPCFGQRSSSVTGSRSIRVRAPAVGADTFVSVSLYLYLWHVTDVDMCLPLYCVYFLSILCRGQSPQSPVRWMCGLGLGPPSATPFSTWVVAGFSSQIGHMPFKLVSNNFRLDVHKST